MLASTAALLANLQPPERRLRPFRTADGVEQQGQVLESLQHHLIRQAVWKVDPSKNPPTVPCYEREPHESDGDWTATWKTCCCMAVHHTSPCCRNVDKTLQGL